MKLHNVSGLVTILLAAVFLTVLFSAAAQTSPANSTATSASVEVPRWIRFSGIAQNENGKPLPGTLGITFALYKDQQGGAPLWLETQNVRADAAGHYIALLGSATAEGVPLSLFSSAEVHWIGVQVSGYPEQPRVLLLSVPYALKAVDAETLGGLPASAFVQANPAGAATATTSRTTAQPAIAPSSGHASSKPASVPPPATVTGAGTTDYIPLWTSASALGNSLLFQTGGNVGVGTTTPGAKLDSAGTNITIRGTSSGTTGVGVVGKATSTTGVNFGVKGATASTANGSAGVSGAATGTTGQVDGVYGSTSSTTQGANWRQRARRGGHGRGLWSWRQYEQRQQFCRRCERLRECSHRPELRSAGRGLQCDQRRGRRDRLRRGHNRPGLRRQRRNQQHYQRRCRRERLRGRSYWPSLWRQRRD